MSDSEEKSSAPQSKQAEAFRVYSADETSLIAQTYKAAHENQTCEFVHEMKATYASPAGFTTASGKKIHRSFQDVFELLDTIIDESDPDTDSPQSFHSYQTAEELKSRYVDDTGGLKTVSIRALFSDAEWGALPPSRQQQYADDLASLFPAITNWDWLPLIGLLHDCGKVLATTEWNALKQWAVVGDTFPVGAPFASANVYFQSQFFKNNKDLHFPKTSPQQFGIYKRQCGFDRVDMSWGHDEYLFSVLNRTYHQLPAEALYIIRYHSFYAWHTPRNGVRGYTELASEQDWQLLPLLKAFQKCDLYSKDAAIPDMQRLQSQYAKLIQQFIPGRPGDYDLRAPAKITF
jgi:inositol oxygenase